MAKAKAKKQSAGPALPPGFTQVAVGGSFGESHDFKRKPILQGKVLGVDRVTFKDKDTGKKKTQRVMRVQSGNLVSTVWESHQLQEVFSQAKRGKEIYLRFLGKKKLGGGKSVNLFQAAIK